MKHPNFGQNEQNDSIEFYRVLSEDVNIELNEAGKKFKYKEIMYSNDNDKVVMNEEFIECFKEKENSIITQNFYSQLISSYICECQKIIYSFQKIGDIPLILPNNKNDATLKELLDKYFSGEMVDFEYKCKYCNKKTQHLKYNRFSLLPKILILTLLRINILNNTKNDIKVTFEDSLDLDNYIDKDIMKGVNSKYKLYGVISHIGSVEYGHYIAYLNLGLKDIWYEYNDSAVVMVGKKKPLDNAYILFL